MVTGQADSSAARKWNLKAPRLDWSFLDLSRLWSVLGGLPDWSRLRSGFWGLPGLSGTALVQEPSSGSGVDSDSEARSDSSMTARADGSMAASMTKIRKVGFSVTTVLWQAVLEKVPQGPLGSPESGTSWIIRLRTTIVRSFSTTRLWTTGVRSSWTIRLGAPGACKVEKILILLRSWERCDLDEMATSSMGGKGR